MLELELELLYPPSLMSRPALRVLELLCSPLLELELVELLYPPSLMSRPALRVLELLYSPSVELELELLYPAWLEL